MTPYLWSHVYFKDYCIVTPNEESVWMSRDAQKLKNIEHNLIEYNDYQ